MRPAPNILSLVSLTLLTSLTSLTSGSEELADSVIQVVQPTIDELEARIQGVSKIVSQTLSWFQHTEMERKRAEGSSGLLQVRNTEGGTRSWMTNTWARKNGQAAIHNHANNIRTVGMGEFNAVMNGVQFRTRHNDYRLNMPSTTSTDWSAVEPIPFPSIPPSVTSAGGVPAQIAEMKEYFRAWSLQDKSIRDYTDYFKPVLTYMQGMFVLPDSNGAVEEPFFSDRHSLAADTWFELQEKVMFNSLTGRKDIDENIAALPTAIMDVFEDGTPSVAQWNYKILCHPIQQEVPLSRFRVVDDLSLMMRSFKNIDDFAQTRNARFQLHPDLPGQFNGHWSEEKRTGHETFLEELMYEVPGMDNYPADHEDSVFGSPPLVRPNQDPLNAGYYHRYYGLPEDDASGLSKAARSFADSNLWVALNNQSKIAPIKTKKCLTWHPDSCTYEYQRVSYAIPLEVTWLTPLSSWNPYNIVHSDDQWKPVQNGRNGNANSTDMAYDGSSDRFYYLTPAEMFEGSELDGDPADTVKDSVYVLDGSGTVRRTTASGMRIFLPNMPGVGSLRTRYPIFPVHDDGSNIMKELTALKDLVRKGATYAHLYENPLGGFSTSGTSGYEVFEFQLSTATTSPHTHTFELTANQIMALKEGSPDYHIWVETSIQASHSHTLEIRSRVAHGSSGIWIVKCGSMDWSCGDGHQSQIFCTNCPLGLLDP